MSFVLLIIYVILTFTRPYEVDPGLGDFRMMLWLGLFTLAVSLITFAGRDRLFLRARQLYLMICLYAAIVLSRIPTMWPGGIWQAINEFSTNTVLFYILLMNLVSVTRVKVVLALVAALVLFIALQGILGYHWSINEETYVYSERQNAQAGRGRDAEDSGEGYVLRRIKALGFLNNPNNLAQALLTALPFVALAWKQKSWARNVVLVLVPSAILLYALYLTFSRTAVVGLTVLVLMVARRHLGNSKALVAAGVVVLLMMGLQFGGGREFSAHESSAAGRIDAWAAGIGMLKTSPVVGVGYGVFPELNVPSHLTAHNSYVLCFAELGLLGYFVWLALLVVTFMELSAIRRAVVDPDDDEAVALKRCAGALEMAFWPFLACCYFAARTYSTLLYILLGVAAALIVMARSKSAVGTQTAAEWPVTNSWILRTLLVEVVSIIVIDISVRVGYR